MRAGLIWLAGHHVLRNLTLGVALILSNGGLILFGSTPVAIRSTLSSTAWELGPFVGNDVSVFVNKARGIALVVSLAVAVSTLLVMHHRIGEDPDSLQELAEISAVDAGATAKALGMAGVVLNLLGEDLR